MRYEQDTLRKLQLAELEILKDIDRVCRDNAIPYFLDSGTLLGAVRHKGFIPWDDDVDLGMLRPDYERFLQVAPQALGEGYEVSDPHLCPEFAGMFAKVWKRGTKFFTEETIEAHIPQGIFVDIFPYDPLHSDAALAKKQRQKCRFWQNMAYLHHSKHITVPHRGLLGSLERGACAVAHVGAHAFWSHDRIVEEFSAWARCGEASPSDDYLTMAYVTKNSFPLAVLMPPGELFFEDHLFSVPANTKAYLPVLYGSDWQELPPLEARRNHAPVELDFGEER